MTNAITPKEQKTLNALAKALEEDCYCADTYMISNHSDLSEKQIEGCVSSLLKKGVICEVEPHAYEIIQLNSH